MYKKLFAIVTLIALVTVTLQASGLGMSHAIEPPTDKREARKSCTACAAGSQSNSPADQLDSLATLGNKSREVSFAPVVRSTLAGATVNFVATATGNLSFAHTDLSIAGLLPFPFQRVYTSDRNVDTGLGKGWSFVFDDRITVHGEKATLQTGGGSELSFRRTPGAGRFGLEIAQPDPHQSFDLIDSETISEQVNGLTRTYKKVGALFRLSQIAEGNGNKITISFDARQNISRIASGGGALTFEWSESKGARLLAVSDHTGRRVSFKQDGDFLSRVIDPAGAAWGYEYGNGRLTRSADPDGRVLLRANYDKSGHAVAVGDAVGLNKFQYEFGQEGISTRTTVTDSLGAQTIYEHNRLGAVVGIKDDEGHTARVELNAGNRPTHIYDSAGAETRFAYDRENRLTSQINSDGNQRGATYDERGQIASMTEGSVRTEFTRDARGNTIAAVSSDPAQSYRVNYDRSGQRSSITNDSGRAVSFEYDAQGNEAAFTYTKSGRFETARDRAGNIVSRRMPSGTTYSYEYDARGMVKRQSDDQGRVVTFERDAGGAPARARFGKDRWISATRDEAGRVVSVNSSMGKSRRFAYDSRGALKDYTDPSGLRKQLEYDHRGRLRSVSANDGTKTLISRDRQGRIDRIARLDQQGNRYDYNPAGKLIATTRTPEGTSFEKAAYTSTDLSRAGSSPALFDDGSCFFGFDGDFPFGGDPGMGGGTGFGGGDPFGGGSGCGGDPFFGFGGGGGGFDPFMGLGGETCGQCLSRQREICRVDHNSCLFRASIISVGIFAGCTALTGLLGMIVCTAAGVAAQAAGIAACENGYTSCTLAARDHCPQCN